MPYNIKQAANADHIKCTAVDRIPSLKEPICAKFKKEQQLEDTPGQVIVSVGGKEAIFNAFMATLSAILNFPLESVGRSLQLVLAQARRRRATRAGIETGAGGTNDQ